MNAEPYLSRILDDEGLAGDLEGDATDRFVGWMVTRAKHLLKSAKTDAAAKSAIEALCKRGREISAEAAKQPDQQAALEGLLVKEV